MCSSSATTESLKPHKIVRICVLIANIVSDGASLCTKYVRWRTRQCSKFGNSVSLINTRLENRLIEDTSHQLASMKLLPPSTYSLQRGRDFSNATKGPFQMKSNRWYYALGYGSRFPVYRVFAAP